MFNFQKSVGLSLTALSMGLAIGAQADYQNSGYQSSYQNPSYNTSSYNQTPSYNSSPSYDQNSTQSYQPSYQAQDQGQNQGQYYYQNSNRSMQDGNFQNSNSNFNQNPNGSMQNQGQPSTQPQAYNNNQNNGWVADNTSTISDQDLNKKVQNKIAPGTFSSGYPQVRASVNNGVVTLQGTVKTFDEKNKLEKEIRNLDGVRVLKSQISVQDQSSKDSSSRKFGQDTAATSADDQLNKKIRDKVSRGWLWDSYTLVTLNTSNGVVTLEGIVDTVKDQQKLANEIQKVDGVKAVNSNLHIKNP